MRFCPNKNNILIHKLRAIRIHRLLPLLVLSAIILAEIIAAPLSIFFHGKVTCDYIISGAVTALLVSLIISYIILQVQEALKQDHDELGRLVDGRTGELSAMNDQLKTEINNREQMEEALRESEKRYHTLFEQSPDGIVLIDMTGKIIEFNVAAHLQLGYTREEFARLQLSDINTSDGPGELQARIRKVSQEGKAEFEVKHQTRHGEIRDVYVISKVLTLAGQTFLHAIWRDITERKRAREALAEQLDFN